MKSNDYSKNFHRILITIWSVLILVRKVMLHQPPLLFNYMLNKHFSNEAKPLSFKNYINIKAEGEKWLQRLTIRIVICTGVCPSKSFAVSELLKISAFDINCKWNKLISKLLLWGTRNWNYCSPDKDQRKKKKSVLQKTRLSLKEQ